MKSGATRAKGGAAAKEKPHCDAGHACEERHAVAVDADIKTANLKRLRRIEGQVRGLYQMVEADRYCPDILVQLSAAQEALRQVGRALMTNHLKHCISHSVASGDEQKTNEMYDELTDLIFKHSR